MGFVVNIDLTNSTFSLEADDGTVQLVQVDEETDFAFAQSGGDGGGTGDDPAAGSKSTALQDDFTTDGDGPTFQPGVLEDLREGNYVVVFGERLSDNDIIAATKVEVFDERPVEIPDGPDPNDGPVVSGEVLSIDLDAMSFEVRSDDGQVHQVVTDLETVFLTAVPQIDDDLDGDGIPGDGTATSKAASLQADGDDDDPATGPDGGFNDGVFTDIQVGFYVAVFGEQHADGEGVLAREVRIFEESPVDHPGGPGDGGETPAAAGTILNIDSATLSFEVELDDTGEIVRVVADTLTTDFLIQLPVDVTQGDDDGTAVATRTSGHQDANGDGVADGVGNGSPDDLVPATFDDLQVGYHVVVFGEHDDTGGIVASKVEIFEEHPAEPNDGEPDGEGPILVGLVLSVDASTMSFEVDPDGSDDVFRVLAKEDTEFLLAVRDTLPGASGGDDDTATRATLLQNGGPPDGSGDGRGLDLVEAVFDSLQAGRFVVVFGENDPATGEIIADKVEIYNEKPEDPNGGGPGAHGRARGLLSRGGGRIDVSHLPDLANLGLGRLFLDIPANAILEDLDVEIGVPELPTDRGALQAVEFIIPGHTGRFEFMEPVIIGIPFPDDVADPAMLTIQLWDLDSETWVPIDLPESVEVDAASGVVTARVTHFSIYGVQTETVGSEDGAPNPDLTGNGFVDFDDFLLFAGAFGSRPGDGNWNPQADLDENDSINFDDFLLFAGSFGKPAAGPALTKPVGAVPSPGGATLTLVTQSADEKATVRISVEGMQFLEGFGFRVDYDADSMEWTSAVSAGESLAGSPLAVSPEPGVVLLADAFGGDAVGGGELATLRFRIIGEGSTDILLSGVRVAEAGEGIRALPDARSRVLMAPARFALETAYPNPFNPETTVPYAMPEAGHVRLTVYNLLGQVVSVLVDAEASAGRHSVRWDGRNSAGAAVGSGIYFVRMTAEGFSDVSRLTLLK